MGGTSTQAKQVLQYARSQWKTDNEKVEAQNEIIRDATRRINSHKKPGERTFNRAHPALNGGDYNSINGFDSVTTSIASEHRDSGLFNPDHDANFKENQEKLWEMLQEGIQPKASLQTAQQRAFDEWEASNPKLREGKPAFETVKESPLSDGEQKALYDAIPRAALAGNTAKAHTVIDAFQRIKEGKPKQGDAETFVSNVKELNRNELWVLKNGLKIGMKEWDKGSRVNQINTLLEKANLGHHAIDQQPKDVPFSEEIDDATQEARNAQYNRNLDWNDDVDVEDDKPFQTALQAWMDIDGDAEDLAKLIKAAYKKPTLHAEPANHLVAPTGPGKKADDREAIMNLMDKALIFGPRRLSRYFQNSLREHGIDNVVSQGVLFTESDRKKLQDDLASVLATADLVGRARVRIRAEQAYKRYPTLFADTTTTEPAMAMPEDFPLLTPMEAYDYFTNLVPTLHVHPDRFGELMERQAFTLAVATEKTLLEEVQRVISDSIREGTPGGAVTIRQLMIQCGVAPQNPFYAEMCYRTNVMDAAAVGHDREMNTPDMQEVFPAFLYSAIVGDGRGRPWHVSKNGLLYPSNVGFVRVRGTEAKDVIACRCCPIAIDKFELADRLGKGEMIQSRW